MSNRGMMAAMLGPISSAPSGPLLSLLSVAVAVWGLTRNWMDYRKGRLTDVPPVNIIATSAIAVLFLILGIRGLLRW